MDAPLRRSPHVLYVGDWIGPQDLPWYLVPFPVGAPGPWRVCAVHPYIRLTPMSLCV